MSETRATIEESAGGVVVRRIDGVAHALLIRDPYRKWGLPKGHVERGESMLEAALREVAEETGLTDLRAGPELVTIDWAFGSGEGRIHKFATFFLLYSDEGDPIPDRTEGISECRWVPLTSAPDEVGYENAGEVVKAAQRRVASREVGDAAD